MTTSPRDVLERLEAAGLSMEGRLVLTPRSDAEVSDALVAEAAACKPELLRLVVLGFTPPPPPDPRPELPDIATIRQAAGADWWSPKEKPTPDGAALLLDLIRREWPGEAVRRLQDRYLCNLEAVGPRRAFSRLYGDCVLFTAPPPPDF